MLIFQKILPPQRKTESFVPHRFLSLLMMTFLLTSTIGCDFWSHLGKKKEEGGRAPEAIKVETMSPILRNVTDYEEFTGETSAVDRVEIQAKVRGYLESWNFKEGSEVAKGDLLFQIQPDEYQAARDAAQGALESLKAQLPQLENDVARNRELQARKAASSAEYEKTVADRDECRAKIKEAEAVLAQAEIDLRDTRILSPIDGYISRRLVTEGNLIQPHNGSNATLLAEMVSLDPIYVHFNMDGGTYLKLLKMKEQQFSDGTRTDDATKIDFRLSDEDGFLNENGTPRHSATIDYSDPFMDKSSQTILLRAVAPNPKSPSGLRTLLPGMMVHVRVPTTNEYEAILVPEEALVSDQGTSCVYVVTESGEAKMSHLTLGPLQSDNMRVVRTGLKPEDKVIVSGLLRLRPGSKVSATETTLEKLREGID